MNRKKIELLIPYGKTREVTAIVPCRYCKEKGEFPIDLSDLADWVNGKFVQDAFPYLDSVQREMLVSNTCGTCFKKIFGEEEE